MIISKDDFSKLVEKEVSQAGVSYMDAIVICAGHTGIEVEVGFGGLVYFIQLRMRACSRHRAGTSVSIQVD